MNGRKTIRVLTPAETTVVGGADFSWGGLQASMAGGVVTGAMVGGTTLGFVVPPGALLGGFVGGLVGGASYVWSEITD